MPNSTQSTSSLGFALSSISCCYYHRNREVTLRLFFLPRGLSAGLVAVGLDAFEVPVDRIVPRLIVFKLVNVVCEREHNFQVVNTNGVKWYVQ
jgi:hypothetical protein